MIDRDPIEALADHYGKAQTISGETLLVAIYAKRSSKRQRVQGLIGGFAVGTVAAIGLLSWAARPAQSNGDQMSAAIARYQMINSGLAERASSPGEIAR